MSDMKSKSMPQFIKENRAELDAYIREALGHTLGRINDTQRREWILDDKKLYRWAKSIGLRL